MSLIGVFLSGFSRVTTPFKSAMMPSFVNKEMEWHYEKKLSRMDLIQEFEQAPEWALFSQETVAAIRDCSLATMEHDR